MNTENTARRGKRLQLILVALIFAVPMIGAWWMYFADDAVRPEGRTNHGLLLEPIVNLREEFPDSQLLTDIDNRWALVYQQSGPCAQECMDALYKQRQMRLMLGNDMSRLVRVLLHGSDTIDTLDLEEVHGGLLTLTDKALSRQLLDAHSQSGVSDGYYLIDPLGNLVMYFPVDIEPRDLVDDLEHLLKLSRIG